MAQARRKFDEDFKIGAVHVVRESGKPIAQVARELGVNEGTLGNWCARDRRARAQGSAALNENERAELERLRKENAELRMQRDVDDCTRAAGRNRMRNACLVAELTE
jgi:transposase